MGTSQTKRSEKMSKSSDGARDRGLFIDEVENMSFRELIQAFDTDKGKRFPVVIIDELISKAHKEQMPLFNWMKSEFNSIPSIEVKLHDKYQKPIQEVFKLKNE
jgi:hypothetical protein